MLALKGSTPYTTNLLTDYLALNQLLNDIWIYPRFFWLFSNKLWLSAKKNSSQENWFRFHKLMIQEQKLLAKRARQKFMGN